MSTGFRELSAKGVLALLTALTASCQPKPPVQATYNLDSKQDLFPASLVLSPEADQEAIAIMRNAMPADGGTLAPAAHGVRWSDVPKAARWGAGVAEMAVLSEQRESDRMVFQIITAADDPVTLTVTREPPPTIYSASISAGLFGDRTDIEQRLRREFDSAMQLFGRKRLPAHFE